MSLFCVTVFGQSGIGDGSVDPEIENAEAVIEKAVEHLGGPVYLNVTTTVGEGKFSLLKDGRIYSFQSFIDVIVYPDKERTDFEERGSKTVQVNTGDTGWIFEEHLEAFNDQSASQVQSFTRSLQSHYDFLLRGNWREEAELSYIGRRQASLGKRNDVVKLEFKDGFAVEYEFDDDGLPMKTIYTLMNSEKLPVTEETRYAQFIKVRGILTPFIVDRFTNDAHTFRVNYESVEYNRRIPDGIFAKPDDTKKLRKKLKL